MTEHDIISTIAVVKRPDHWKANTNSDAAVASGEFGVGVGKSKDLCVSEQIGYIASHKLNSSQVSELLRADPSESALELKGKELADLTLNAKAVIIRQTKDRCDQEDETFYINVAGAANINYNGTAVPLKWNGDLSIIPNFLAVVGSNPTGLTVGGDFSAGSEDSIMYVNTSANGEASFNVNGNAVLESVKDTLLTIQGTRLTVSKNLTLRTQGKLDITHSDITANAMAIDGNESASCIIINNNKIDVATTLNATASDEGTQLDFKYNAVNASGVNITLNNDARAHLSGNIIRADKIFNMIVDTFSYALVNNTGIVASIDDGSIHFTTNGGAELTVNNSSVHAEIVNIITYDGKTHVLNSKMNADAVVINSTGENSSILIKGNELLSNSIALNTDHTIETNYTKWGGSQSVSLSATKSMKIDTNSIAFTAHTINQSNAFASNRASSVGFNVKMPHIILGPKATANTITFQSNATVETNNFALNIMEILDVSDGVVINATTVDFETVNEPITFETDNLLLQNNATVSINARAIYITPNAVAINANNIAIAAGDQINVETAADLNITGKTLKLNADSITFKFKTYKPPVGTGALQNTTTGISSRITYEVKSFNAHAENNIAMDMDVLNINTVNFTVSGNSAAYTASHDAVFKVTNGVTFGSGKGDDGIVYITKCADGMSFDSAKPLSITSNGCATIFFNLPSTIGYTIIYDGDVAAANARAVNADACFDPYYWWPRVGDVEAIEEELFVVPDGATTNNNSVSLDEYYTSSDYKYIYKKKIKQSKISNEYNPSFRGGGQYDNTSDGVHDLLRYYHIKELRTPNGVTWAPGDSAASDATLSLMYPSTVVYGTILRKEGQCESDIRLKSNISELSADEFIEKASKLRPVSYTMDHVKDGERINGFIAQEVREIFPDLVTEDPHTGILSLKYIQLVTIVPILINKIEALRKKLEDKLS